MGLIPMVRSTFGYLLNEQHNSNEQHSHPITNDGVTSNTNVNQLALNPSSNTTALFIKNGVA